MLPKMDGLDVCAALRKAGVLAPIIMLTARTQESDKELGLDAGADDYVTKPFSIRELRARVRAQLRRDPRGGRERCIVSATARSIWIAPRFAAAGQPVEVTAQELKLLAALLEHRGRVLSRAQLIWRGLGPRRRDHRSRRGHAYFQSAEEDRAGAVRTQVSHWRARPRVSVRGKRIDQLLTRRYRTIHRRARNWASSEGRLMRRVLMIVAVALMGSIVGASGASRTQSSEEIDLRRAIELEKAKGQIEKAIEIYKKLAEGADRAVAEQAKQALGRLSAPRTTSQGDRAAGGAVVAQSAEGRFASSLMSNDPNIGLWGVQPSPSGRYAAGVRPSQGDFHLRDLETGTGSSLFSCPRGCITSASKFSPDGRRVAALVWDEWPAAAKTAFASGLITQAELQATAVPGRLVVSAVPPGTAQPVVVDLPQAARYGTWPSNPFAWSPDGRQIAYVAPEPAPRTYGVRLLDVESGLSRSLGVTIEGNPVLAWSRSALELAAHAAESTTGTLDIHIVLAATGAARTVTVPADVGFVTLGLQWTTTGEVVVRQVNRPTGEHKTSLLSPGPDRSRDVRRKDERRSML